MKKLNTYTPELREEAVKLVLAQGLMPQKQRCGSFYRKIPSRTG